MEDDNKDVTKLLVAAENCPAAGTSLPMLLLLLTLCHLFTASAKKKKKKKKRGSLLIFFPIPNNFFSLSHAYKDITPLPK